MEWSDMGGSGERRYSAVIFLCCFNGIKSSAPSFKGFAVSAGLMRVLKRARGNLVMK
jgi:hypothetical protein